MSMSWHWQETTREIYRAIYDQHNNDVKVFESFTDVGEHGDGLRAQTTAWGFKDADHPIMKSELRMGEWKFYILRRTYEEE